MKNKRIPTNKRELLERLYRSSDDEFNDFSDKDDAESTYENQRQRSQNERQRGGYRRNDTDERSAYDDRRNYDDRAGYRSFDEEPQSRTYNKGRRASSTAWKPVIAGCTLSCLVTIAVAKSDAIGPLLSSILETSKSQPIAVTSPVNHTVTTVVSSNPSIRVPGLSASRSTITGFADAESMSAAYYWTLTLANTGQTQQEAQMRIAVPAGTTISRATLWVNGIAQEAAFSSTAQVNRAYEWVKNGRQQFPLRMHDPLVITQESPGHILIKAAPVEPGGQEMKLRIGFTAPLRPDGNRGSLQLAHIEDSNFNISNLQDVHIESLTPARASGANVTAEHGMNGTTLLRGNIRPEELGALNLSVDMQSSPNTAFATRATHSRPGWFILATMSQLPNGHSSIRLAKTTHLPEPCRILNSEPAAARLSTLWAHAQIESLVRRGNWMQADELARVHRVVSSVSGAAVLELDSDYAATGLNRNLYSVTAYSGAGAGAPGAAVSSRRGMLQLQRRAMHQAPSMAPEAANPPERRLSMPMAPAPSNKLTDEKPYLVAPEAPVPSPMPQATPQQFDAYNQDKVSDDRAVSIDFTTTPETQQTANKAALEAKTAADANAPAATANAATLCGALIAALMAFFAIATCSKKLKRQKDQQPSS